jgi:DNA repair exonuclease SbcCD ATPase subunit
MNLTKYKDFLSSKKATLNLLTEKKQNLLSRIEELKTNTKNLTEAQEVMNIVGVSAQEEVKQVIESLVTQALQAVFGESYSFEIESKIVRNQPEIHMYVVEGGERTPVRSADDNQSGGIIDLISFTLRVVFWAINSSRTRNCLVFDEPFKNLDSQRLALLGEIIKLLSKMLDVQFIIITRENQLSIIGISDASYSVTKKDGISLVEKIVG